MAKAARDTRLIKLLLGLGLGFFLILYGIQGLATQEIWALFYQTTARWVYGEDSIIHSWIYIILGFLLVLLTCFLQLGKKKSR